MRRNTNWYMMKAHHINDGRKASLQSIRAEQGVADHTTVLVVKSEAGEKFIVTSGHPQDFHVGDKNSWTNDTGMGYRSPPYGDHELEIVNIIHLNGSQIIKKVNDVGLTGSRSTWVFK